MKCNWLNTIDVHELENKKILVAGGTGFIGKHLVKILNEIGCNITVLTRKPRNVEENITYIQADLCDINTLRKVLIEDRFDYSVYMAANIPLAGSKRETYLEAKKSTLDPFVNFCEVFLSKINSFVYISSVDVMGVCEKENYTEVDNINNPTPYGLAKYCGEYYTRVICENLKIPYSILRFSQVYGPNEPIVRIIPILKRALLEETEFNLYTHGDEKRRFLFIDDAVQAVLRALVSNESGIYNIAGKDSNTMLELISIMEQTFEKKLKLHVLNKVKGVNNIPSIENAEKKLGFVPNYTLVQGIKIIKEEEYD